MKAIYTAVVDITHGRDGAARSDDGKLDARLAFPPALGGTGDGTNPEQLLAAGWGACFASSLAHVARRAGAPLGAIAVRAEVDMLQGEQGFGLAARLRVTAAGAPRARVEQLVAATREVCPYSRALDGATAATYEVAP